MSLQIEEIKTKTLDEALNEFITVIKNDTEYKENFFKYIREKKNKIESFIKEGKSENLNFNQLIVLRKWNSYTPILPIEDENKISIKGGGYFISFCGKGIVIDPGYNFVENFFKAGCKLDDIDAIFITHAHDDHTSQLESIFSLLYKRNKDLPETAIPKKVSLYLNLGSFKKFAGYFDLSKPTKNYYIERIIILNKHQLYKFNDNIKIFTTHTKHHEMITENYALGLTFILEDENKGINKVLKFTSDTGWNSELERMNKVIGEEHDIQEIDYLICHIGSLKEDELKYDINKSLEENEKSDNVLYKYHLGILGTVAEIYFWKPSLTLVSEFGQELFAIRKKIVDKISTQIKSKVYAVDLNFRLDIENGKIRCYKSKEYFDLEDMDWDVRNDGAILYYNKSKINATELYDGFIDHISVY